VLGDEGLGARPEQELAVDPGAQERGDQRGVTSALKPAIRASTPTAINVSGQLYQNSTARKIARKGRSSTSDTEAPEMNSRIVSTACSRATSVPQNSRTAADENFGACASC